MEEKVEVMRGETAQITCMYTSDEGIGGTTIEWLVVSFFSLYERLHRMVKCVYMCLFS